ncbi:MAG: MFS transporter [Firmicutes bacterium]|nr:MFS transporter [Bacillota bacterium]
MASLMSLSFAVLTTVPFIMVLGNSMLIPVLPAMQKAMALNQLQTGLIITAFSIPAGITIPLAGFFSDRYGRKAVMVPSLAAYGAGGVVAGLAALFLAEPYLVIMAGRVLQGIGAAGTANIALALAGDSFSGNLRNRSLGILEASNGAGKMISPVAGALAGMLTWFTPFWVYAILSFPITAGVALLVRESKNRPSPQSLKTYSKNLGKIFEQKGVSLGASLLAGAVVLFLLFGVLFYLSDILEQRFQIFGLTKGLILAIPVLASSATAYITGSYLQGLGRKLLVAGGLGLTALALGLFPFFNGLVPLFAIVAVVGVGAGLVLPTLNTLVTGSVDVKQRGMITADYGAVRFLGVALGPPAFGLAMGLGEPILFTAAAVLALAAAAAAFFLIREQVLTLQPA